MRLFRIGTLADWFGVGLLEGIRQSERVGAEGVQLYAAGELDPNTLTAADIRMVKRVAADCSQTVSALCGELGGHGLCLPEENPQKIAYLKRTVDLALALDCTVVTTHLGVIPKDQENPTYRVLQDACGEIGAYAKRRGACIAIETGPEPVERLVSFIKSCAAGGIAINYDPANLVMVLRADEVQGVYQGGGHIVHTHAKDGRNLVPTTGEEHYAVFAEGGVDATRKIKRTEQTPIGLGSVRWPEYLTALKDIGYRGFLTIEREVKGETTAAEIAQAVVFLREHMARIV